MSFLGKLFGGKKKGGSDIEILIGETLGGLLDKSGLDLTFDIKTEDENITIELSGEDEDLLKDKEGQTIDAIQLFLKRVVQHNFPEDRSEITIDCNGFREESNQQLVDLAEKLKGIALEKGKSVYFRALAPKDRKVIHQYLAGDARVKSRSIGDGLFKKIKIYPVKSQTNHEEHDTTEID